ncbi:flavodoxin family protein [Lacticaseibacillus paracasei]|uniref:flavodoxin family protein n=1 Tax=Lacticaseibacillus paracasei TaxID=1597 RepID=UPI0021CEE622|nr:flavodoxin family protein [Lacticaseibacillus paracasei]MCU6429720.1 flavodoxin family protein [Lacticaseibacillus paracasei]
MKIILINASNQKRSNAVILAKIVLQDFVYEEVELSHLKIKDVEDHRFDDGWTIRENDDFYELMNLVFESDLVVMSSPIYWYSVSARLSRFIERWSESLNQKKNFRSVMGTKKLILVLAGGDHPQIKAKPIIKQFEYIADFSNIEFYDAVIGCANRPGTVLDDVVSINQANALNQHLKHII